MHIHVTDDPGKIREIKARYFEIGNDFHLIPILESPEDGLKKSGWDDICVEILAAGDLVVICSNEFAKHLMGVERGLAVLAESGKRAAKIGKELRDTFLGMGRTLDEAASALRILAH